MIRTSRKFTPAQRTPIRTSPGARERSDSGHGRRTTLRESSVPLSRIPSRHVLASISSAPPIRSAAVRTSRGAKHTPSRSASCDSSRLVDSAIAISAPAQSSTSASSICPGFSACAVRNSPHAAAWPRSGTSSDESTAIAPRVSTTSRASSLRLSSDSQFCTRSSTYASVCRVPSGAAPSGVVVGQRSTVTLSATRLSAVTAEVVSATQSNPYIASSAAALTRNCLGETLSQGKRIDTSHQTPAAVHGGDGNRIVVNKRDPCT